MDQEEAGPLDRFNGRVTLWLARLGALFLASIGLMTFLDVVARYAFNRPFAFTVEITEIMMGLVIYLSVGLATHEKRHIGVDVLTLRVSKKANAILDLVVSAIGLVMMAILVWQLFLRAGVLLEKGDYTPIYRVSYWPGAYIMAIGTIFYLTGLAMYMLRDLRDLRELKKARDSGAG